MGSRVAISAGVLALALAAVPLGGVPAFAEARDCERGNGLLSGVTNGLCQIVDGVTDAVDGVTGDTVKPVTKGVDDTAGQVLDPLGDVAPTTKADKPSPSGPSGKQPQPDSSPDTLLPDALDDVCLPVLACGDQSVLGDLTHSPDPLPTEPGKRTATPTPSPTSTDEQEAVPTDGPTQPPSHPQLMETDTTTVTDEPTIDTDEPTFDLLWPNPLSERLSGKMRDHQVVRPSATDTDAIGTALTTALLVSAILATRVIQQRRRRDDQNPSIPFEPLPHTGRHRLA